ncbi:putative mating-type switch/DNA repair protein Swi10/Rad10 [Tothia fuscella]|uniref:Mating-type switch/DNA repair protein Swi10/Rad10 n=1 Tax=Tothia fuscella TaxID=1048955 RepID=A0A9P4TWS1_9PEZI|nr:putative mating-type switch/DNA repair protein Swi10/Rad10 [Tothia fuscella]
MDRTTVRPSTTNANAQPSRAPISPNPRQFQTTTTNRPTPPAAPSRGVVQPKPQDLRARTGPSNIIVSTRQKGNPILKEIKNSAWEYGDIDPDYILGVTTCALFLSLKYHRLHPEYIYGRIRALQGRWNLRVLLVMVDITAHEESLKELSKTSLINNVTIMLCWSTAEAGRYLELYKVYENAPATAIKAPPSKSHGDRLIEFITTPRSVNKTDALGLVSNFGSVRTAVNARPEEILLIAGWGQTKVKQWNAAVSEPFRTRQAKKRGLATEDSMPPTVLPRPPKRVAEEAPVDEIDEDEDALLFVAEEQTAASSSVRKATVVPPPGTVSAAKKLVPPEPDIGDGVMAALARLREQG